MPKYIQTKCANCGLVLHDLPKDAHEKVMNPDEGYFNCLICPRCSDMASFDEIEHYVNFCWNCKVDGEPTRVDELFCHKSATPNMGYHCWQCGKDLTEKPKRVTS